jgi:hypothetical protein
MFDSQPVAGEYPRLFFTRSDIPALRARLEHPDCRALWNTLLAAMEERVRPDCRPVVARHIRDWHLAFGWLITGRRQFAEKAIELLIPILSGEAPIEETANRAFRPRLGLGSAGKITSLALCYDWLYDNLVPKLRAKIRNRLEEGGRLYLDDFRDDLPTFNRFTSNGTCVVAGPLAMAALLLDPDPQAARVLEGAIRHLATSIDVQCHDGGYSEGPAYANYSFRHFLLGAEPLRRLKGRDLMLEPHARNIGDYFLNVIHPYLTECFNVADCDKDTRLWPPVAAAATRTRKPELQDLARKLLLHDWQGNGEALEYSLFYLLFYDPSIPAAPPAPEKRWQLFSGIQQLHLRSGWDPEAIHMAWQNGPANCHHNHLHLQHLTLAAFGERLLTDLGYHDPALHFQCYRLQTAGHNTLLADGEGQPITTDTAVWCKRMRAGEWGTVYGLFDSVREEPDALTTTGRTVNAYPGRLSAFERTLAFYDKRCFLLHDWVKREAPQPVSLEWHFHTPGRIFIAGGRARMEGRRARLLVVPLCREPLQLGSCTGLAQYQHPEENVSRLDVKASCVNGHFEWFAALVPYQGDREPVVDLAYDGSGVRLTVDGLSWFYDPAQRSSLTPEQRLNVRG